MDPELLGCLLEGVVHGKLPDLLLELVETLLAPLLMESDDSEVMFGAVLVWLLVMLVITFSWSLCGVAKLRTIFHLG